MGRDGGDADSELVVIWGALPVPQIVDYHDRALYIDRVIWCSISVDQRWEVVDALRGLRVGEHLQLRGWGAPTRVEQDAERIAQITQTLWTTLVELEAVVDALHAETRVVLYA